MYFKILDKNNDDVKVNENKIVFFSVLTMMLLGKYIMNENLFSL